MGTRGATRSRVGSIIVFTISLALAGCATTPADATGAASATPSDARGAASATPSDARGAASATPSVVGTSAPTPRPTLQPAPLTCETMLLPAAQDYFATRHMVPFDPSKLRDDETWFDKEPWFDKVRFMVDDGGLDCWWGQPNTDFVHYALQLAVTESAWASRKAELLATGFVEESTPVTGYLNEPDTDPLDKDGGFVYRAGQLYFVSYPELAQFIPAVAK